MKKIIYTISACICISLHAQNYISGPMGVFGPQYNAATTIASGGNVLVGNGGNWYFGGKISNADKTDPNSPNAVGRSELITFSGSGTYSGAALIDGYASTTSKTIAFVLPIGNNVSAYPVTVPAGINFTGAYFDGSGSSRATTVNTANVTVYSPYIDLPAGITTGRYTFTYPSGFKTTPTSILVTSNNTSVNGTFNNTTYSLLSNLSTFQSTGGATSASLSTLSTTQIYFGSSATLLPVTLVSFTGLSNGCTANLAWQTANENNSSYYAIETSMDGTTFNQITTIASKNNLTGSTYSYAYNQLTGSTTYFRLKAVDNDGTFTYSQIITVTGTGDCSPRILVKVSPNPTRDMVNIQGLLSGTHIILLSLNGQKLAEITSSGGSQSINLSNYPSGIYILHMQNADGSINNTKVVKQ